VIDLSPDIGRHERATLMLMREFARVHREARLLYVHTKGVSYPQRCQTVEDWIELLLHFVVREHQSCLTALAHYDTVGCNHLGEPRPHYSGNFWWARAAHVASLPDVPSGDRHAAEWWILGAPGTRALSLWDSGVNHYKERYPRDRYDTPATRARLEALVSPERV
jgi:hypothetical protein